MRLVSRCLLLAPCAVLVLGCASSTDPASEESAVDQSTPSSTPSQSSKAPSPVPGAGSPDVQAAIEDLATSLDVEPGDVEVVAVEEVTWRDGSRGCAAPGNVYTQALIDGSRITLRVAGTDYEYHSGGSRPPALCENPTG